GNQVEVTNRNENSNTPSSPRRGAFESLCLRSPMPKILLEKLQNQIGERKVVENEKTVSSTQKKVKYVFKAASAIKVKATPSKVIAESPQEKVLNVSTPLVAKEVIPKPISAITSETTKQAIQSIAAPQSPFVAARMQSFSFMSSPTANIYHTPTNQSTTKRIQINGESPASAIKSAKRALSTTNSKPATPMNNEKESPANLLRSTKRAILPQTTLGLQTDAQSPFHTVHLDDQATIAKTSLSIETQPADTNDIIVAVPSVTLATPSKKPPRTPAKTPRATGKKQVQETIAKEVTQNSPLVQIPTEISASEVKLPANKPGVINTNITVRKKPKKRKEVQTTPSKPPVPQETSNPRPLKLNSPAIFSIYNKSPKIKVPTPPALKVERSEKSTVKQKKNIVKAKDIDVDSPMSDTPVERKKTPLKRLRKQGTPTPTKRPALMNSNSDDTSSIIVNTTTPSKSPKAKQTPLSSRQSVVDLASSDTEDTFVVKDVRKDPLAKFFSFHDVPSSEDESEDLSFDIAPRKPSSPRQGKQSDESGVDSEEERGI
ncbi:hypothetical protein THRCLA_10443, partial [Thraustotheca clavata]